jgi:SAM-dependent methyltransferase
MTTERPHRVCPWWLGYLLASPLRRILIPLAKVLAGHVRPGMTVLEPGPGMGFFTLELARLVGASGRVIAVDIQPRMLDGLRRRAAKAGVLDRVDARLAAPDSLGLADLEGVVDFTLASAVVHELPAAATFFREVGGPRSRGRGCSWWNQRGTSQLRCLTPNCRRPRRPGSRW